MPIGENRLVACPQCCSRYVMLRRTRGWRGFLNELAGRFSFTCLDCETSFIIQPLSWSSLIHAKCPECLGLSLHNVRNPGPGLPLRLRLALYLGAQLLECRPCRNVFISWRPLAYQVDPGALERIRPRRRFRLVVRIRYRNPRGVPASAAGT